MNNNLAPIILASKSPRRQELLKLMGIDFKVISKDVDESYPEGLTAPQIALYISEKKAHAFDHEITNEIVITADTIVSINNSILGKPDDEQHAYEILSELSGSRHEVITAVSLLSKDKLKSFYDTSEVFFTKLRPEQIWHYIKVGNPMDKAGAYGIQEWIGLIGIERINGSYTTVVGLPTHKLAAELELF